MLSIIYCIANIECDERAHNGTNDVSETGNGEQNENQGVKNQGRSCSSNANYVLLLYCSN